MRKVECEILDAIESHETRQVSKRDAVIWPTDNVCVIRLWGNTIATLEMCTIKISSCGWHSTTTKSRLNALLEKYTDVRLYQKNKIWYLTDGRLFEDEMTIRVRREDYYE